MDKKSLFYKSSPADVPFQQLIPSQAQSIFCLPGDKIIDVKMFFEVRGINGWLDHVVNYLMLEKNGIINFPAAGNLSFRNVTVNAKLHPISDEGQVLIIGQTIREIYYHPDQEETSMHSSAFIELSNGHVIYEHRIAPRRTGAANLYVYTREEFAALRKEFGLMPCRKLYKV
jgi:hypothetical protein